MSHPHLTCFKPRRFNFARTYLGIVFGYMKRYRTTGSNGAIPIFVNMIFSKRGMLTITEQIHVVVELNQCSADSTMHVLAPGERIADVGLLRTLSCLQKHMPIAL